MERRAARFRGDAADRRAPRLVLRFAVFAALGLGGAAAAILLVVRHENVVQAERSAIDRASFVARAVLRHELRPSDLAGPVQGERRSRLDELFRDRILTDGALRGTLYSTRGEATYSSDHRLIGGRAPDAERLAEAARGEILSTVASGRGAGAKKVLVTYVPVVLGPDQRRAVIALEQDYEPIAAVARRMFAPIAGVLEAVLLLLLVFLAPMLARVSRRIRRHVEQLDYLATHDDLTGLPNRRGFVRALSDLASGSSEHPAGMVLVDLGRFKEINDALGARAGDLLLVEAARRLLDTADGGVASRLGANEFGLVVADLRAEQARHLARRALDALARPFTLDGVRVAVQPSAGVAFTAVGNPDADVVLRHAGVALRLAKERRTGVEVYDPDDDSSDVAVLTLSAELRDAIDTGQLVVHYQLQADIATGAPRGVEALVRWQHPERGLLPPSAFLEVAESTGLAKELARRVLSTAVAEWLGWRALGHDLHLSVNLTAADLLDLSLPDDVAGVLSRNSMPADRLVLEVTESTLMGDEQRTDDVLARLVDLGVQLAIDDFGTGYSSLTHLRRLPVHEVKIDRSFIAGVPDNEANASMVRWTVELAHGLGLRAVAEGVERSEQWDFLRTIGCDRAQGYFLSRPLPSAALLQRLDSKAGRPRIAAA